MTKKTPEKASPKQPNAADKALLEEARTRFAAAMEREGENWKRAKEAIKFRALDQWPETLRRMREDPNQKGGPRPCPVLDKTNQYVRQVVNEMRMNRPGIKVRPVDDKADPEVAEAFSGIIRQIEDSSNADIAYTTAGEQAVDGGFGYLRLLTEYCDQDSFDQQIKICEIKNRFSVLLGPHTKGTGEDAEYGFIFEDVPKAEFKRKYPKSEPSDFERKEYADWYGEDSVRVAEYIKIEKTSRTIVLLDSGETMPKDEYEMNLRGATAAGIEPPQVVKERESDCIKVCWYKLSANAVLERGELAGKRLPIFKVVGNEIVTEDGKSRQSGMIEAGMDAQRLHNYAHAKFIEAVALAPLAPFTAAAGQTEKHPEWQNANTASYGVLTYDVVDVNGQPLPPPQRQPMAGIPAGWQQLLMNTGNGIEGAFGMYGASVGGPSRERSGIALGEQKEQGQVTNYHYVDNLSRAVASLGALLIEWIVCYYDTRRATRILGDDKQAQLIFLDPEQEVPYQELACDGKVCKSYNLGVGRYDVTVSSGPSFLTKREEASKFAMELTRADPTLLQKAGDKIFRLFDVYGMDDIAERLKMFLPPEVQNAENKDKRQDPKVAAGMMQVKAAMEEVQARAQQMQEAEMQLKELAANTTADKAALDAERTRLESERKVFKAEVERAMAQLELKAMKLQKELDSAREPLDGFSAGMNDSQTNRDEPRE